MHLKCYFEARECSKVQCNTFHLASITTAILLHASSHRPTVMLSISLGYHKNGQIVNVLACLEHIHCNLKKHSSILYNLWSQFLGRPRDSGVCLWSLSGGFVLRLLAWVGSASLCLTSATMVISTSNPHNEVLFTNTSIPPLFCSTNTAVRDGSRWGAT